MYSFYCASARFIQVLEGDIPCQRFCSTAEALAWDVAFRNLNEPSGRAVRGVHEEAYAEEVK